jgi:hypothetical protein
MPAGLLAHRRTLLLGHVVGSIGHGLSPVLAVLAVAALRGSLAIDLGRCLVELSHVLRDGVAVAHLSSPERVMQSCLTAMESSSTL